MIESGELSSSLTAAGEAVGTLAAASLADLDAAAAAAAMSDLTALIGRLDGLRVTLARHVGDRQLYRDAGARSLHGWLRADPRLADDAWKISRLAFLAPALPKVTGLLAGGQASLAQAGAAAWQIASLPSTPKPPPAADDDGRPADATSPDPASAGEAGGASPGEPGGGERWAGLWMAGDVHAAADELFAGFLPKLSAQELRAVGAHLREAADPAGHARDERSDYLSRAFRVSPSLGGAAEISGRLHPEAAAQVIATFTELGAKTGPDDTRTKPQRWADALLSLATRTGVGPAAAPADGGEPGDLSPANSAPAGSGEPETEPGDDQPGGGHGHASAEPGGQDQPRTAAPAPGQLPSWPGRPRVIVTVPLDALLRRPLAPGAVLGDRTPLSGEAARRIGCDADIIRLITAPGAVVPAPAGDDGNWTTGKLKKLLAAAISGLPPPLGRPSAALDVGRKHQGWTPRQRDAIHAQHGGRCGWPPGCASPIEVIHHLVHWADGGPTSVANAWPACGYHHWLVHEGGWQLLKRTDGTITASPPPPGWTPGTIYRHGRAITEQPPAAA